MARVPGLKLSVSATTRGKRVGEQDGREYFFLTRRQFLQWVAEGLFLEWAEYTGNLYGTPAKAVNDDLAAGHDVILEIELKGADNVLSQYADALMIYIMPPSLAELERRLRRRGTESEEAIVRRLSRAKEEISEVEKKMELSRGRLHYAIVNGSVKEASKQIAAIIERSKE